MQDVGQAAPQNPDRPSRSSIDPPLSLAAGIDAVSRTIWCGAPLEDKAFSGLELGISARGTSDIGGQLEISARRTDGKSIRFRSTDETRSALSEIGRRETAIVTSAVVQFQANPDAAISLLPTR
jgi:hypothetical protein